MEKGVQTAYTDDESVRVQNLFALPFLPIADEVYVFDDIIDDDMPDALLEIYLW